MARKVEVEINYRPRVWQNCIHNDQHRFKVVLAHRQCGKSYLAAAELLKSALLKRGEYAFIAPEKQQAKATVWKKFKEFTEEISGIKYNNVELTVDFPNGSTIYLLAANETVRGKHFSGAVMDEVADMDFAFWGEVLRPALEANEGWGIVIGTPKKGENLLNHLIRFGKDPDFPNWSSWEVDVYTSGVMSEERIEALKREILPSQFRQEYMLEESSTEGAIYAPILEEMEQSGQIDRFPYDSRLPVYTGWDIGYNDYTVIWFAQYDPANNRIYLIDFYRNRRQYMDHYINHLLTKPYRYATAFLPHDVDQTRMDKQYSELAKFKQCGLKYRVLKKPKNVMQSVQAVQAQLNRCFFNVPVCNEGLEELESYDTVRDKRTGLYTDKLKHCDVSDAFRYLIEGLSGARESHNSYENFKQTEMRHQRNRMTPMQRTKKSLKKNKFFR